MESDSFYHVSEDDLRRYTMRLLELAREALLYLVYAIGIDERKKDKMKMQFACTFQTFQRIGNYEITK